MSATGTDRGRANTVLFVLLGLLFAVAIAEFAFLYFKNAQDRQAINYTTQIQVSSQQLAKFASEAAGGNELAFKELEGTSKNIDVYVDALNKGEQKLGGMPSYAGEASVAPTLATLTKAWGMLRADAKNILDNKNVILSANTSAKDFTDKLSALNSRMSEVVNILTDRNASASQVYVTSRQMQLADRMGGRVTKILAGGADTQASADGLQRDSRLYETVVAGLLNGAPELNIKPLDNAAAKQIVEDVATQWLSVNEPIKTILESANNLQVAKDAADKSFNDSQDVLLGASRMAQLVDGLSSKRPLANPLIGAAAAAAMLLLFLGLNLFREQRRRLQATNELNQRNQDAILRLLDEMGSLAEGDLTVKATVTEDITGAIADSVNFAVEALRSLVTTINETAVQVSTAAQETQSTAMSLANAAQHQARQISSASVAINDMAHSIDTVSKNSAESADVAQRSVQIAANGAQVVRQTIEGMDSIRDQIQETSKRIKRLGESSQEIGSIVELINDIAEQTNILALNAAIQAASAGEAGRGFAVVADEVQRLAERASGATKRIETLVQTIQSDTNEAVSSMEQTTSEVVSGARRAEDAGQALGEIENVSNNLATLIQGISTSARQQSVAASNISSTMNVIQDITSQTSVGASQTAESIGNLAQLAANLRRSVADFKLPG